MNKFILVMPAVWFFYSNAWATEYRYFEPGKFELTCTFFRKCQVEKPCVFESTSITVQKASNEDDSSIKTVDWVATTAPTIVYENHGFQLLMLQAGLSESGPLELPEASLQLSVFPDAQATLSVHHFSKKSMDYVAYGRCLSPGA